MKLQTKHLFKVLTIANKMEILDEVKGFFSTTDKKVSQEQIGMEIMSAFIEGIGKAENEIYELLADLKGLKVKDIKEQDPIQTIEDVKAIAKDDVFTSFLSSATNSEKTDS